MPNPCFNMKMTHIIIIFGRKGRPTAIVLLDCNYSMWLFSDFSDEGTQPPPNYFRCVHLFSLPTIRASSHLISCSHVDTCTYESAIICVHPCCCLFNSPRIHVFLRQSYFISIFFFPWLPFPLCPLGMNVFRIHMWFCIRHFYSYLLQVVSLSSLWNLLLCLFIFLWLKGKNYWIWPYK